MSTAGENIFWTFSYSVLIIVYRVYSLSAIIYFPNGLRYIFLRLTDLNRPGDGESPMAQMCTNKKLPVIHEKNNVLLSELVQQRIIKFISTQLQDSQTTAPKDIKGMWNAYSYYVGGHLFTLDEIEHGILRFE